MNDLTPMQAALEEARAAALRGEVPVGAVLVDGTGKIIAKAGNETRLECDPTAHAEMIVLRAGAKLLDSERLTDCTLYVTLEPCAMCAGAISHARLKKLVFGAYDPKGGAIDHGPRFFAQPTCLHKPEIVGGMDQDECGDVLRMFFKEKR